MSELVVHNEGGRKQKKGDIVKKGVAGVDNTSRRTWDKDEFAAKAAAREAQEAKAEESALDAKRRRRLERDPLHQGLIVERAKLKQRDFQIDLTSRVGKTQVITNSTPLSQQSSVTYEEALLEHCPVRVSSRPNSLMLRFKRKGFIW